jgi:sec-independent protein translocase protein TatB
VFDSLGWAELAVLLVLALFVFGPERLPGMAADAGKALRKLRLYAKSITADVQNELGPELGGVDLASLNPRTFVEKHLLSDDEDESPKDVRSRAGAPLRAGEPAPWDPDAT